MSPLGQGDLKWGRSLKEETQRERGQGPREGRGLGKEETGLEGSLEEKAISSPCPGGAGRGTTGTDSQRGSGTELYANGDPPD